MFKSIQNISKQHKIEKSPTKIEAVRKSIEHEFCNKSITVHLKYQLLFNYVIDSAYLPKYLIKI